MLKSPRTLLLISLTFLITLGLAVGLQGVLGVNIAGTLTGPLNLGGNKITNVGDPTADGEAATQGWVKSIPIAPRKQMFTSSGTFTVPAGVTKVYVSLAAGGGGGGGTGRLADCPSLNGGNGGSGSFSIYVTAPGGQGGGAGIPNIGPLDPPGTPGVGGIAGGYNGTNGKNGVVASCDGTQWGGDGGHSIKSFGGGKGAVQSVYDYLSGIVVNGGNGMGVGAGGGGAGLIPGAPTCLAAGGGGGGGGHVIENYEVTGLSPLSTVGITVGLGGAGGGGCPYTGLGGMGANGFVLVEW